MIILPKQIHKILSTSTRSFFSSSQHPRSTQVDDYQITGFLGKGSTSRIYQGYNIITKKQAIIKLFKSTIPQDKIKQEIRINQMLIDCPYVVQMIETIRDEASGNYGIVFNNLFGIPMNQLPSFQFIKGLKYMKDVLSGIEYCHSKGIVHRDLKNSNILITKNGARIFDFGLSKIQNIDSFVTKRFGTKCYYTPQVLFKIPTFSRKIDIWTCGVIMTQVLAKIRPLMPYTSDQQTARQIVHFSGYDQDICHNSYLKGMKRVNFIKLLQNKYQNKKVIQELAFIIQQMLNIQPSKRPQASQILKFDIFKKIQSLK